MDQTKPDKQSLPPDGGWNISELYSRAWQVVKKNKILWILGAAGSVGGSYNFNSSNSFKSEDFQKIFSPNTPSNPDLPNQISQVLGASTDKPLTDSILHILSSVPMAWYILGAVEFLVILFIGIIISLVYRAWTQGMLIAATDTALRDQKITVADISKAVIPKIKSLIWLNIVPGLVFALAILVVTLVLIFAIALVPFPIKILPIILAIAAIGAAIYWAIILAVSLIWAPREIILNQKRGKESLIAGYRIAKKKFWASLVLGVVNNILSAIVVLVPVAILIALIVGGAFAAVKSPSLIPLLVVTAILASLPIIFGLTLLGGIIESFKAVVWTDAYSRVKGKYDH